MYIGTESFVIALVTLLISAAISLGGIYLLVTQEVTVRGNRVHVMSVEIPVLGRLKSAYPSVVAIFVGAALGAAVWQGWKIDREQMSVRAQVKIEHSGNRHADVFLAVVPQQNHRLETGVVANTNYAVQLKVDKASNYLVFAFTPISIDQDGYTQNAVAVGSVDDNGEFKTVLRLR